MSGVSVHLRSVTLTLDSLPLSQTQIKRLCSLFPWHNSYKPETDTFHDYLWFFSWLSTRWSVTSLRGPGERNFNAVSHKPKLTGTDWIELNWCARWFMGYGIKISFPRPPQWRHRSPGMNYTPNPDQNWLLYIPLSYPILNCMKTRQLSI